MDFIISTELFNKFFAHETLVKKKKSEQGTTIFYTIKHQMKEMVLYPDLSRKFHPPSDTIKHLSSPMLFHDHRNTHHNSFNKIPEKMEANQ